MASPDREFFVPPADIFNARWHDLGAPSHNAKLWDGVMAELGVQHEDPQTPGVDQRGNVVPGAHAIHYDRELWDGGQFNRLSLASRYSTAGLGLHMMQLDLKTGILGVSASRLESGVGFRRLSREEILADVAAVVIGREVRSPILDKDSLREFASVCHQLGTIGLLQNAYKGGSFS